MEQNSLNSTKEYRNYMDQTVPIKITRILRAPIEWIWKAWSDGDVIKQWWGLKEYVSRNAATDFRIGGKYLFDMEAPNGRIIWTTGIYEKIIPHNKIVFTEHFSDSAGSIVSAKKVGVAGNWPEKREVTVEFEKVAHDQVKMIVLHEGIPLEMRNPCIRGWNQSLDKFQLIVERYGDENLKQNPVYH